jgi:hypothetical protein
MAIFKAILKKIRVLEKIILAWEKNFKQTLL